MVPATPAQFQFSHALSSPARQRFHLRASRHLCPAVCRHFTFVPGTPESEPPSAPERRASREAPSAFSRPQAPAGAGRGGASKTGRCLDSRGHRHRRKLKRNCSSAVHTGTVFCDKIEVRPRCGCQSGLHTQHTFPTGRSWCWPGLHTSG